MAQQPSADSSWIALRAKHQDECVQFARRVAAEKEDFFRRINAAHAELLARHAEQERNYWRGRDQHAPNTTDRCKATVQSATANANTTTPNLRGTSVQEPLQPLLPTTTSQKKQQVAVKQETKQQLKPSPKAIPAQQQNAKRAPTATPKVSQPQRLEQLRANSIASRPWRSQKKEAVVVNLCSDDDDDLLVEVSKAKFEKDTAPTPPFRPGIPTATLQLFGEGSKKFHAKPEPTSVKRELLGSGSPTTHGQDQSRLPQGASDTKYDSSALDASPFNVSRSAAGAIPPPQQHPSSLQPNPQKPTLPFDTNTLIPRTVLRQQVEDPSRLTVKHATLPANRDLFALQQHKQNGGSVNHILENKRSEGLAPSLSDVSGMKSNDGDVDMEDVPLALLNVKAVLKKLNKTTPTTDTMDTGAPIPAAMRNNMQKTHLPSPSPSLVSANESAACATSEATKLLNAFKSPAAPGDINSNQASTVDSRASSRTLTATPSPNKEQQNQCEAAVTPRTPILPRSSSKRKVTDMSDDEQDTYSPSKLSHVTERKKFVAPSNPSSRRTNNTSSAASVSKPKGRPPTPSAPPSTPVGKATNGFGFRPKITKAPPNTPATPFRKPVNTPRSETPRTPNETTANKRQKPDPLTPGKRQAAAHARSKIQEISQAEKELRNDDQTFKGLAKEVNKVGANLTDLNERLSEFVIRKSVPIDTPFGTPKPSSTSRTSVNPAASVGSGVKDKDLHTKEKGLKDKATEHRLAARRRNINALIGDDSDEDYDDLDISEYSIVNGIIVHASEKGR